MYLYSVVILILEAIQTNLNRDSKNTGVEVSPLLSQSMDTVSIEEIDILLEYLYEIEKQSKGALPFTDIKESKGYEDSILTYQDNANNGKENALNIISNKRKYSEHVSTGNNPHTGDKVVVDSQTVKSEAPLALNNGHSQYTSLEKGKIGTFGNPFSNNKMYFKEAVDRKTFCFLLLDVLKNLAYYRFNIHKLLHDIKTNILAKEKRKSVLEIKLQKTVLFQFIRLSLVFVQRPSEFLETGISVFYSENLINIKDARNNLSKRVNEIFCKNSSLSANELQEINNFNKILTDATKLMLHKSSFKSLMHFFNEKLGNNFFINRYYDMFVCFLGPLYKISVFFDENKKGLFEKYLTCPPLPKNNFYSNYSLLQNDAIFYWVVEWLYYFSNYCKFPKKTDSKNYASFLVQKYPQEFFIQLHLLIYFVMRHQVTEDKKEYNEVFVDQLKKQIKILLFHSADTRDKSFYESNFFMVCTSIKDVGSHKIYIRSKKNHATLIRTTEENKQHTDSIEPILSSLVDRIIKLVLKVSLEEPNK